MKDARQASGLAPVGRMVPALARGVFARYGFAVGAILTEWRAIVGTPLADHTLPERLAFPKGSRRDGTLHLRVESAWALEVQHLSQRIVERINAHFGFSAVQRLTLRHGPMPKRPQAVRRASAEVPPPEVTGGPSDRLNAALASFGAALLQEGAAAVSAKGRR